MLIDTLHILHLNTHHYHHRPPSPPTQNNGRCSPTRASLLTGLYSHQVGITFLAGNSCKQPSDVGVGAGSPPSSTLPPAPAPSCRPNEALSPTYPTIAELLHTAGYFTAFSGKWHLSNNGRWHTAKNASDATPRERGFNRTFGFESAARYGYQPDPPWHVRKQPMYMDGTPFDPKNDARLPAVSANISMHPALGLHLPTLQPPQPPPTQPQPQSQPPPPSGWYITDLFTHFGLQFIQENKAQNPDQPFFLYLAHVAPHLPLQAAAEDIARFRGGYSTGWNATAKQRQANQRAAGLMHETWTSAPPVGVADGIGCNGSGHGHGDDHIMSVYAAVHYRLDQAVGNLVAGLKAMDAFDSTVIFFLSDNGASSTGGMDGSKRGANPSDPSSVWKLGRGWATVANTPFKGYKGTVFEGGVATPFVVHWPDGIAARGDTGSSRRGVAAAGAAGAAGPGAGWWEDTPSHVIDVLPTILDLASVQVHSSCSSAEGCGEITEMQVDDSDHDRSSDGDGLHPGRYHRTMYIPAPFEGKSMLPLLQAGVNASTVARRSEERALFFEHDRNKAVRQGKWKWVWPDLRPNYNANTASAGAATATTPTYPTTNNAGKTTDRCDAENAGPDADGVPKLYNLEVDRAEQFDLTAQFPKKAAELQQLWERWAECVGVSSEATPPTAGGANGAHHFDLDDGYNVKASVVVARTCTAVAAAGPLPSTIQYSNGHVCGTCTGQQRRGHRPSF